jgi:hypothetical protein
MLSRSREWAIAQRDGNCEKGYTFWLIGFAKKGAESLCEPNAEPSWLELLFAYPRKKS